METVSTEKSFGGTQGVYRHSSDVTGCDMSFALFLPPQAQDGPVPVLWYLSGLTCTHANVMEKGEYRRAAAELGMAVICPDTSPRGSHVPDEDDWTFGGGAGFYLDATEAPWSANYRMFSYISQELPAVVAAHFPLAHGPAGHLRPFDGRAWRPDHGATPFRQVSQLFRLRPDHQPVAGRYAGRRLRALSGPRQGWLAGL